MSDKLKTYLAVIVAMSIWANSFIVTRIGLESFNPVTVVTMRMMMASLLLFVIGKATRTLQPIRREDLKYFIPLSFVEPFLYFVSEAYGLQRVSPTIASVIMSTIPLFSPLFAFILVREKVSFYNLIGIMISMVGVLILVYQQEEAKADPIGIAMLFMAVFSAVIFAVLLRKVPSHYSNVTTVFYQHAFSLLFFIPTFFLVDYSSLDLAAASAESYLAIALLALFASVVAFILFTRSVRKIGVTKANAFCNVMPGITAICMYFFFGESLPLVKIFAIAIVIFGLFISQKKLEVD